MRRFKLPQQTIVLNMVTWIQKANFIPNGLVNIERFVLSATKAIILIRTMSAKLYQPIVLKLMRMENVPNVQAVTKLTPMETANQPKFMLTAVFNMAILIAKAINIQNTFLGRKEFVRNVIVDMRYMKECV